MKDFGVTGICAFTVMFVFTIAFFPSKWLWSQLTRLAWGERVVFTIFVIAFLVFIGTALTLMMYVIIATPFYRLTTPFTNGG